MAEYILRDEKIYKTETVETEVNVDEIQKKIDYCKNNIAIEQALIDQYQALLDQTVSAGVAELVDEKVVLKSEK